MIQDAVVNAMVSGQWAVTSFAQNDTDITSSFAGYKFEFYSNMTVDAIDNGTVIQTGTWNGNATAMTTWANFPNAGHSSSVDQRNMEYYQQRFNFCDCGSNQWNSNKDNATGQAMNSASGINLFS